MWLYHNRVTHCSINGHLFSFTFYSHYSKCMLSIILSIILYIHLHPYLLISTSRCPIMDAWYNVYLSGWGYFAFCILIDVATLYLQRYTDLKCPPAIGKSVPVPSFQPSLIVFLLFYFFAV